MGAKQSSPVYDARTRAYSSSDLPSGHSSGSRDRVTGFMFTSSGPDGPRIQYTDGRPAVSGLSIPSSGRSGSHGHNQSLDGTDGDDEGQISPEGPRLLIGSLPAHLSPHLLEGLHCPVCSKRMASDEMEKHLLMCFSQSRLSYNKDVLSRDSGECAICLEELEQGETIARLPCLCIYHKGCIDEWFEVNRSCPEHPSD
ncbi:E3 ubiquitin-protein ligase ZNRF2 [Myripristis murdjan]|uniref:E3 ubiquitin-protein ligase ZNRF1 n=1 Tax=Myripristis murdjan TaxID=586833 RepID=A0A667X6Q5_9TELE|nr:E3 ubiquitin-protein ligase ZNRF2 [Myripristis murdjan]